MDRNLVSDGMLLLASDSTVSTFAALGSATISPNRETVIHRPGTRGMKSMILKLVGTDANNETVKVRVVGWTQVGNSYIPDIICELTGTLSSSATGVTGGPIGASSYFADAITLDKGYAGIVNPTGDTVAAKAIVPLGSYSLIEIQPIVGTGAAANAVYQFSSDSVVDLAGIDVSVGDISFGDTTIGGTITVTFDGTAQPVSLTSASTITTVPTGSQSVTMTSASSVTVVPSGTQNVAPATATTTFLTKGYTGAYANTGFGSSTSYTPGMCIGGQLTMSSMTLTNTSKVTLQSLSLTESTGATPDLTIIIQSINTALSNGATTTLADLVAGANGCIVINVASDDWTIITSDDTVAFVDLTSRCGQVIKASGTNPHLYAHVLAASSETIGGIGTLQLNVGTYSD